MIERSTDGAAGKVKVFVTVAGAAISVAAEVSRLSDIEHALAATLIFAFFAVYVAVDMLWWRGYPAVWVFGPLTIAVATYWWIGFMARHGVPEQPILPAAWYPPQWAYFAMAAWLSFYAIWDIVDARANRYRDESTLVAGAVTLLFGVGLCLFLTLRSPVGR